MAILRPFQRLSMAGFVHVTQWVGVNRLDTSCMLCLAQASFLGLLREPCRTYGRRTSGEQHARLPTMGTMGELFGAFGETFRRSGCGVFREQLLQHMPHHDSWLGFSSSNHPAKVRARRPEWAIPQGETPQRALAIRLDLQRLSC